MALSPLFGEITPTAQKQLSNQSYLDFTSGAGNDFSQQYLPEIYEAEVERYGNRTLSGFLQMVGAEMPMTSDQVIWSEQNRLHISYDKCTIGANNNGTVVIQDHDNSVAAGKPHAIRVQSLIVIIDPATSTEQKAIVSAATATQITAHPFGSATWAAALVSAAHLKVFVYGSEFKKGTAGMDGSVEPSFTQFNNSPIIIKDKYGINGSDTAQIGWIEVSGESGQGGYLWYLKAESDTRARFNDYIEMAMIEAELADTDSEVQGSTIVGSSTTDAANSAGSEGLFAAIEARGNITTGVTGVNAATDLAEFDAILAEFDKQGAIEEYMMFVNRSTSLAIDDMLASMNSYGAGGTSYGVFDNDEDMALNLGFSGFRRGSYDFYKSDFRYLNDKATRGGINDAAGANAIRGVMIPAGVSTVYDQVMGKNMKRPFLHVRYRASATDDRRMKSWVTGSVGAATSALDAMQLHFLSERCLVTQGANNFMLMQ